jgi:hypothetical protein
MERSISPEIPDSQGSPPHPIYRTTRDDRIAIRTALRFRIPYIEIRETLGVTEGQIRWAKAHPITP